MRYNSPLRRRTQVGDTYKRKRFAWLPTRMMPDSETVLWCEHYEEEMKYFPGYRDNVCYWDPIARTPIAPTTPTTPQSDQLSIRGSYEK